MTTVIVTAISVIGGVVLAILPSLIAGERKRLLKLLVEESAALEAVTDKQAKRHLRASLRATTLRYQKLARQPAFNKALRHAVVVTAVSAVVLILGTYFHWQADDLTSSDKQADWLRLGCNAAIVSALVVLGFFVFRFMVATVDYVGELRVRRAEAAAKLANDQLDKLEGSVKHFIIEAKKYGGGEAYLLPTPEDEENGLTGAEVDDLLAEANDGKDEPKFVGSVAFLELAQVVADLDRQRRGPDYNAWQASLQTDPRTFRTYFDADEDVDPADRDGGVDPDSAGAGTAHNVDPDDGGPAKV